MDIVGDEKDNAVAKETIALQNTVSRYYTHLQWVTTPQSEHIKTRSQVTELLTSKDNIWSMVI